jgi:hypothetical protein
MASLGCGDADAVIVARDDWTVGLRRLGKDLIAGSFDRRLNDVSEATVQISDCYTGMEIVPWEHALLLSWDGEFVWGGPIIEVSDDESGIGVIHARDVMEWMRHRKIRDDYSSIGAPADVTTIFLDLINNGFGQDPSVAYGISSALTTITAEREYRSGRSGYVYDAIVELATTGIDWTVLLDVITCGDVEISTTPIGVLNHQHLLNKPAISRSGLDQANFVTVVGSGRGYYDDYLSGLAQDAGSQATYGLLDLIEDEPAIEDQISLDANAQTRLDLRLSTPIKVGDITLGPTAPLNVSDLVPGAVLDCWFEGRHVPFIGNLRLKAVSFAIVDGKWTPTLSAQPVGTTA